MPILDHFGILAPYYDRLIRARTPEKLIDTIGLPMSGKLLDAGGGTGRVSQSLNDLADLIVVADLSLEMLIQASEKQGLTTVCSHTECMPFPDESFERVIMVDALHHVSDHAKTAYELWRVVKPGGRVVIEEPDIRKFPVQLVALAEKIALMRSHFYTPTDILAFFPYPNAHSKIVQDGYNFWVIVDKHQA